MNVQHICHLCEMSGSRPFNITLTQKTDRGNRRQCGLAAAKHIGALQSNFLGRQRLAIHMYQQALQRALECQSELWMERSKKVTLLLNQVARVNHIPFPYCPKGAREPLSWAFMVHVLCFFLS